MILTMKSIIVFSILVSLFGFSSSCNSDEAMPPLAVDFDYQFEGDCATPVLEVVFSNLSQNATSYLWDFGDGTTSIDAEPRKVYDRSGKYVVILKALNAKSNRTITKEISIPRNSNGQGPQIQISSTIEDPTKLEMTFVAESSDGTLFRWDFGDGSPTIETDLKQTIHTYAGPGNYTIFLIATNTEGGNCISKSITVEP